MKFNLVVLAEKIKSLSLSHKESEEFLSIFCRCSNVELVNIVELIEQQPDLLNIFYDNYKKKKDILSNNDFDKWESLMKEEEKFLSTFSSTQ